MLLLTFCTVTKLVLKLTINVMVALSAMQPMLYIHSFNFWWSVIRIIGYIIEALSDVALTTCVS